MTDEILGEGASAVVRLGYDRRTQGKVAIKVVPKLPVDDSRAEKKMKSVANEVNILRYIHEFDDMVSCADLLDVIEDDRAWFLVFELQQGSLHNFVKQRRHFDDEEAQKVFRQLVQAVAFLHRHNISHRDIKVENILLGEDSAVSLCDFGFALRFRPGSKYTEWCGSPFTVAPEILERVPYSPEAVDVWALGSVLYTILCGFFPFQATSPAEVYERTKQGHFRSFPAHVSRTARDLISRCLTVEPSERISVTHILKHPFFWGYDDESEEEDDEGECSGDESCDLAEEYASGEGASSEGDADF